MILMISFSEECRILQDFLIIVKKKKDFSNNSNEDEAFKMSREGGLNTGTWSDITDHLFTESLKGPECVTKLLNCIKNRKTNNIYNTTNKLKEKQLNSKSHLQELSNALDLILMNREGKREKKL